MAKRASGEGSVRQRANGSWEARLSYLDPVTGQRRSASFYAATTEEARVKLDEARDRLKAEMPVKDSPQRLADYIEHWSATALEASPRKEKTKALYRQLAKTHLCSAPFGTTPLDRLRKTHIDGLTVALRKRGLSDSTVRLVYTVLRAVLEDAKLDGLVAENAAAKTSAPKLVILRPTRSPRYSLPPKVFATDRSWSLSPRRVCVRVRRWRCAGSTSTSATAH